MCDLGFALVQVLYFQAQQVAGGSKGETCTGGVVTEQGDAEAALEYFCGDVVLAHETKGICQGKYSFQLIICLLPGEEEVVFVHFFEVQFV